MTMQRSGGLPMASLDVSCLLKTVGARNSCARAKDSARGEQAEEKRGQGSCAAMMTGPKPSSDFGVRCGSGLTNQFLDATECALLGVRYTSRVSLVLWNAVSSPPRSVNELKPERGGRKAGP